MSEYIPFTLCCSLIGKDTKKLKIIQKEEEI